MSHFNLKMDEGRLGKEDGRAGRRWMRKRKKLKRGLVREIPCQS